MAHKNYYAHLSNNRRELLIDLLTEIGKLAIQHALRKAAFTERTIEKTSYPLISVVFSPQSHIQRHHNTEADRKENRADVGVLSL